MKNSIVARIEQFISNYIALPSEAYTLPLALWIIGTYLFDSFDAYPYLVITSATKRSGKTRLAEIIAFASHKPRPITALTAATLFRLIQNEKPTLIIDEAETLSSEAATNMRAVLNVGYRKGQMVPRTLGDNTQDFDTYCPKIFILIGDVYDTLRDRSIVIGMARQEPKMRFTWAAAKSEGDAIRTELLHFTAQSRGEIEEIFASFDGLPFLFDRDEEIWTSLFCLCEVFASDRIRELQTTAADLAVEKTVEARKYLKLAAEENAAQSDEYGQRLLLDLYALTVTHGKYIATKQALDLLLAIPTAPWRKYRGKGLDAHVMSKMLDIYGLGPVRIALGNGRGKQTFLRGYKQADILAALGRIGKTP